MTLKILPKGRELDVRLLLEKKPTRGYRPSEKKRKIRQWPVRWPDSGQNYGGRLFCRKNQTTGFSRPGDAGRFKKPGSRLKITPQKKSTLGENPCIRSRLGKDHLNFTGRGGRVREKVQLMAQRDQAYQGR